VHQTLAPHLVAPRASARQFSRIAAAADPSLVDRSDAAEDWDPDSAVVYPNVISASQAEDLVQRLTKKFRRCELCGTDSPFHSARRRRLLTALFLSYVFCHSQRHQLGHWDSAIQNYRETELFDEDSNLKAILQPIRKLIEENHGVACGSRTKAFTGTWLPCHTIDLHEEGQLNAHVDSVRYSGNLVAGLSLLSTSIMRLKPAAAVEEGQVAKESFPTKTAPAESSPEHFVDLFLPPQSLYVLSGDSRYSYTHELLPSGSKFGGEIVQRRRRLSVIFRDAKTAEGTDA